MTSRIHSVFENLWDDYVRFNPGAKKIYDLFLAHERRENPSITALQNDHVALRTFNLAPIGLSALSAIFQELGYREKGEYVFEEKKLYARHLEHADRTLPKVFISELECEKLSNDVQAMAREVAANFSVASTARAELLWSGRSWDASHARYQKLLAESEYAAWVYAFGFRSNHFTIFVNSLKSFRDLAELNAFVKQQGFKLNSSGGEIKGSRADCLEQSSTLAEKTSVKFSDGTFEIPACYYEFAQRFEKSDGELYQGFVAASADKIFESTNVKNS